MSVSRRFRHIRTNMNLSQEDFGAAIDCTRSHVSRVERGLEEYTYSQLKAIADLAGIPASVMMDDEVIEIADWLPQYFALSRLQQGQFDQVAVGILDMLL